MPTSSPGQILEMDITAGTVCRVVVQKGIPSLDPILNVHIQAKQTGLRELRERLRGLEARTTGYPVRVEIDQRWNPHLNVRVEIPREDERPSIVLTEVAALVSALFGDIRPELSPE